MNAQNFTADELADFVAAAAREAFVGSRLTDLLRGLAGTRGSFRSATELVKTVFGDLGRNLGFEVAAAGYTNANGKEWLYDMCWFLDGPEFLERIGLVMETEMRPGGNVINSIYVDTDFQKIVQARADIRVWFCAIPNTEMVKLHIENCKKQIHKFSGTCTNDTYLFVIYDWTLGLTTVEKYRVETVGDI